MPEEINKALRNFLAKHARVQAFIGKVSSVDVTKYTCDVLPIDDGPEMFDVRLKPSIDGDNTGLICIPVVGSHVVVSIIGNNDHYAYISMFGKVDSYQVVTASGVKIELKNNGELHLNGESLGGIIKANELKTQLDKTNAVVKAIQDALVNWVVVPSDGGAALKALVAPLSALQLGDYSSIKNDKVKHG